MSERAVLVVVVVRAGVLRAALVARLRRAGANLLGLKPLFPRTRRLGEPAMLIVDEAALAGREGEWIEALWLERRWKRVVVLSVDAVVLGSAPDWLDLGSTADTLTQLLEDWEETGLDQAA